MQCPIDGTTLVMTHRAGVEIDYCPQCRGVWLDRGELDKIIDRSLAEAPAPTPPRRNDVPGGGFPDTRRDDRDFQRDRHPKRRESFLSELFDFD